MPSPLFSSLDSPFNPSPFSTAFSPKSVLIPHRPSLLGTSPRGPSLPIMLSPTFRSHRSTEVGVLVPQARLTLCDPMDCSSPGSSVHEILQARMLDWVATPFLQGIFLTQGSNPGLLHCRQILNCLSHQSRSHFLSLCSDDTPVKSLH